MLASLHFADPALSGMAETEVSYPGYKRVSVSIDAGTLRVPAFSATPNVVTATHFAISEADVAIHIGPLAGQTYYPSGSQPVLVMIETA